MRGLLGVSEERRDDEQADGAQVGEHGVLLLAEQADAEEDGEEEAEEEKPVRHAAKLVVPSGEGGGEARLVEERA